MMMNRKDLSRYYFLSKEIKEIEEKIESIRSNYISAAKVDDMPHSHNISNPQEQRALLLEKLTEKLEQKKSDALNEMFKIEDYLSHIEDIETRIIFNKRYVELKKWDKIALEMNMSIATVYRKHKSQLKVKYVEN